jgi:hypothetical protein
MKPLIFAAMLLVCLIPSAFAQNTGPVSSSKMHPDSADTNKNNQTGSVANPENDGATQNRGAVQKIRQDLQSAGFTDVKVVAESFVVQARSKDGNPVLMTIGPHGMSVFEALNSGSSNSGTVGQGGSNSTNPDMGASNNQSPGPQK